MKLATSSLVAVLVSLTLGGCKQEPVPPPPPAAPPMGGAAAAAVPGATTGKVLETMTSGGYTYVRVNDGSKEIWAAGPETTVAVGDTVSFPQGMPMQNFESKTLDRTFDTVFFVSALTKGGAAAPAAAPHAGGMPGAMGAAPAAGAPPAGMPGGMPGAMGGAAAGAHAGAKGAAPAAIDVKGLTKATGGHTVAELFANKATLSGKEVAVRGKVAKFTAGIMGKNWLHLQDGTGAAGTNDLTVTTQGTAEVGKTVLIKGKLATNKDFGFGYKYDVMIEEGNVTVE